MGEMADWIIDQAIYGNEFEDDNSCYYCGRYTWHENNCPNFELVFDLENELTSDD